MIPQSLDLLEVSDLVHEAGFQEDPLIGLGAPGRLTLEVTEEPTAASERLLTSLPSSSSLIEVELL